MTRRSSMWRLAVIWFAGAALLFVILVGQSLVGYYEPRTETAWGWFLPTVMPTLALTVGALIAEHRKADGDADGVAVAPALFWLGAGLSLFYLLLVTTSVLIQPFVTQQPPIELMQRSNLWLGPMQALCVAALGFFFQSKA